MATDHATTTLQGVALPYTTIVRHQLQALEVGESAVINYPVDRVRRASAGLRDRRFDLVAETRATTRATRIAWEPGGYRRWMLSLERGGQAKRLDHIKISSIRATASELGEKTGDRFIVSKITETSVWVQRVEGSDADGRRLYRFKAQAIGDQFTVPAGDHSGLRAMHALCRHHSKGGRVFLARENIDGSITVRCYAEGGLPPKWAVDAEHAKLQERIQAIGAAAYRIDDAKY